MIRGCSSLDDDRVAPPEKARHAGGDLVIREDAKGLLATPMGIARQLPGAAYGPNGLEAPVSLRAREANWPVQCSDGSIRSLRRSTAQSPTSKDSVLVQLFCTLLLSSSIKAWSFPFTSLRFPRLFVLAFLESDLKDTEMMQQNYFLSHLNIL
jgi:hypothetical protein